MPIFNKDQLDPNIFGCTHSDTYVSEGRERCEYCGAVYDESLIDWIYEDE